MARRSKARSERGAAAVEFAIVLPLLAAVLFGIMEFSLIMYDKALITSASREGARFGSLYKTARPDCTQIRAGAVQTYEQSLFAWAGTPKTIAVNCYRIDTAGATTTNTCPDTPAGERLAVETVFAYGSHQLVNMVTGPVTLRSTTVMNCE